MINIVQYAWQQVFAVGVAVFIATREPAAPGRELSIWYLWGFLFLVILVPSLIRYLPFRYRLGDNELLIRSGWLFKQERSIPYQRIQSLDAQAGPLHRISSTVAVTIETGGGVENDGKLDAISREAFEEMRELVLGRRVAAQPADAPPAATTIARLSPGETLLAGVILGRELLLVGGAVGLAYELGLGDRLIQWLFGADADLPGTIGGLFRAVGLGSLTPGKVAMVLLVLLSLLLVVRVVTAVLTAQRLWAHRLDRVGDDLRVTCGAISRNTSTTPVRRIQSLTVREGPWHRLGNRVTVQVATAGGIQLAEALPSRETLAPLLKRNELDGLVAIALGGLALPSAGWQGAAPQAATRVLRFHLVVLGFMTTVAWLWQPALGAIAAIVSALVIVVGLARIRCFRWVAFEEGIAVRSGWIWRKLVVVRNDRIQLAELSQSPFDRRWGMASVAIDTAGSAAPRLRLHHLERDTARELTARIDGIVAATPLQL